MKNDRPLDPDTEQLLGEIDFRFALEEAGINFKFHVAPELFEDELKQARKDLEEGRVEPTPPEVFERILRDVRKHIREERGGK